MAPTNGKSNGHEALAAAAARGDWGAFFKSYKLTDALSSLSLSKRAAHALDWTATRAPGVVVPYNVVLKVVMGYSHTPRLGNEEVERFRGGALGDARRHLRSQYRRDLKSVPGVGVRATVDGLDVVKSTLPASVRRVNSAHEAMKATAALVDDTKLPRLGPDKSWTEWFGRTVSPALRALASDDRIAKLLPSAASKTVDEAEGKKA